MNIMSYLAYPSTTKEELHRDLQTIEGCEAEVAENENLLVLVTEAKDKADEERIQDELSKLGTLACLALVYASEGDQA